MSANDGGVRADEDSNLPVIMHVARRVVDGDHYVSRGERLRGAITEARAHCEGIVPRNRRSRSRGAGVERNNDGVRHVLDIDDSGVTSRNRRSAFSVGN